MAEAKQQATRSRKRPTPLDEDSQKAVGEILDNQTAGSEVEPGKEASNVTSIFKTEDPKFMTKLREGAEKVAAFVIKRTEVNKDIAAEMAKFESDGLNRKAVKAAMSYIDMNEKDQQNYDLTYNVMRKALGQPVQGDLFEAAVASEIRDSEKSH